MTARTEVSIARFRLLVSGVIALEGALLAWNAWHYDWLRGYDAFANHLLSLIHI